KENRDRVDQGFDMVKRNLVRIRRAVSNVLYYVKDREIDWELVSFQDLFALIKKELADYAQHLQVKLILDPDADGTFETGAHPIQAILVNLLEFCLHACALNEDKTSTSISLTGAGYEHGVQFKVQVQGFALEEDTKKRATDDYYEPKGADRSHLSLFITNRLIKRQNGTLEITSSPDERSSMFVITFPKRK
ncbi:MAG: ATP-binding protein, partial [Planctomycetota bacterium]